MARKATATTAFTFGDTPVVAKQKVSDRKRIEAKVAALGALKVMIAMCTAAEADLKDELKTGQMTDYFVKAGCASKSKPDNVDGYEGPHTATLQLRKRGTNMPLSEEEILLCKEHGVPLATLPAPLTFNPLYMAGGDEYDANVVGKLEAALGKLIANGDVPADIIVRTGNSKTVTTEDSIPSIFKMGDNAARALLGVVAVLAVGTKYCIVGDDVSPAIADVAVILGMPALREKLIGAAKNPEKTINPYTKKAAA